MLMRRSLLCILLLLLASACAAAQDTWQKECAELAVLLQWQPGNTVADIGASKGKLTSMTAESVGPSGRVYSTEMDSEMLAALQELAAKHIKASDSATNVPDLSCDSIYMRLMYHHFTRPTEMDSSLFRSLKHGGRLAIVDEEPSRAPQSPRVFPKTGHGIPEKVLISEVRHAGFKIQTVENDWPGGDEYHKMYCVVFRKP